ncbi:MAG: HECT domain-containing protein, partial [archaeon]|nr:HECT domain-containing protein [archaeon]
IVGQVEILLGVLAYLRESYNNLENYFKEIFDFSLPLWIAAIIKIGNFLSYLQGNSTLEFNLKQEILSSLKCNDTSIFDDNLIFIKLNESSEMQEKTFRNKIMDICKKAKCRIFNTNGDIIQLNKNMIGILLDGFLVSELKEIEEEEVKEEKKEPEEEFWFCSACGFENAFDNDCCCACDKPKPANVVKKEEKKETKKKTFIKEEMYTLKEKDMKNDFIELIRNDPAFKIEKNKIEVTLYKDIKKDKNILINKFLMLRLIHYLSDDDHYSDCIIPIIKQNSEISQIFNILKEKLKSNENNVNKFIPLLLSPDKSGEYSEILSYDYLSFYSNLFSKEYDIYHYNTSITNDLTEEIIDINLMEKIRRFVDMTICKESKVSYVYPSNNIHFPSSNFNGLNEIPKDILYNYCKDLIEVPISKIRYYWSIIKYFNTCLLSALPIIKPADYSSSNITQSREDKEYIYILFPKTISAFLSSAKGITLSNTKNNLLNDILLETEYTEEEIQIPTFKFERLAMVDQKEIKGENSTNVYLSSDNSLFLQAYNQGEEIDSAFYRSAKVPGDPKLGFKIEFKGELVQGLAGPYRQFFSDISTELIPDNAKNKKLNLFCPTRNNVAQMGDFKDKYTINPSYNNGIELKHFKFLGMLMGICIRTGVHIPLNLASYIWKKISNTPISNEDILELDQGILEQVNFLSEISPESFENYNLNYSCELSDGSICDLIPNGKYEKVLYEDRWKYLELLVKKRLSEADKQINAIRKGLFIIIPHSLILLLTHNELERYVSGSNEKDIDIDLLRSFTKYTMDLNENVDRIKWLWEILKEFEPQEKKKFIKFCWAQDKLPSTKDEYERLQVEFTIKPCVDKKKVDIFPKADTCFFALELPNYSSKEVMKKLILIAINIDNVSINADRINRENRNNEDHDDYEEDHYYEEDGE